MSFFKELKKRNVFRVGGAYLAASWLIIEVAGTLLLTFGYDTSAVRFVIIVLATGLIPVLIFSWSYEFTSEGLVKESELDRNVVNTVHISNKIDYLIITLLVISTGYFLWESRFENPNANQSLGASIAVLPFVNMSGDKEQEYFSDGISEEILNVLAKIPNLHVTSRSSAFAFKGKDLDLTKVAKQLGVDHILEGSVRKSGTKVRITAQLIEASTDRHLWSETYDRELTDVFAIQDELSVAIVAALRIKLMGDSPTLKTVVRKVIPEAHTAFLKGLYYMQNRINKKSSRQEILNYFDDAIKLDNNYAIAYAYRGQIINMTTRASENITQSEGPQIAMMAIDHAIELDPELDSAYVFRSLNRLWFDYDFKGSRLDLEHALTLNPNNAGIYTALSKLYAIQGNHKQALLYAQKGKSLDPMNARVIRQVAQTYYYQGDFQQAQIEIDDALIILPDSTNYLGLKTQVELLLGNYENALLLSNKIGSYINYNRHLLSMAYSKLGDKTKSDEALAAFIKSDADNSAWQIAEAYCFRGEIEQCLDWLDTAYKQKDPGLTAITVSPFLKPVYQEQRYKELVLKMNIL